MNRTNGSPSSHTSSSAAASTLRARPRAQRLISIDDGMNTPPASDYSASPFGSRAASPIPRSHPSRPAVTSNPSAQAPKVLRDTSAALSEVWGNSWSMFQGLASNVLGNQADEAPRDASVRRRKPLWATHGGTARSTLPKQWGPSTSSSSRIGAGSQEDRESQVRAMKRRDLMTAGEDLITDSVGRIKRRNSDDRMASSAPPGENEDRDALVYIHHVRPEDTLAGVCIKFNCDPAVLRKANGMWLNDSIQMKTTVVLPVDACSVKGRHVPAPDARQEDDLMLGGSGESSTNTGYDDLMTNGTTSPKSYAADNALAQSVSHASVDSEPPWRHDSWVLLPNDTKPTEIGRMPRRKLGFFPPARRKSVAFSDDTTPAPSFDLPRSSTSTDPHTSSPAQPTKGRVATRTGSVSDSRSRHRRNSSLWLHGPGGVGTMGKNVKSPGPAQDGLNKLVERHLPSLNVAPPPDMEYFTPWAPSLLNADTGTSVQHSSSGAVTPLGGIDLQEIGGVIEGWVRKVGSKASEAMSKPSTPGRGKQSAVPVLGQESENNESIELRDDAFGAGEVDHEARGRSPGGNTPTGIPSSQQYQSIRPEFKLTIRDRGRRGAESSKTD